MKKIIVLMGLLCSLISSVNSQTLENENGKTIRLSAYNGKVVVLDFWFTGCINCMNFYHSSLSGVETRYKHDQNVVFVSICIDKDKSMWIKSLKKGMYSSVDAINLYTGGSGDKCDVINHFHVSSYPQPIIIGKSGKVISESQNLTESSCLIYAIEKALN